MNLKWTKAIIVCFLLSLVFTFAQSLIFASGVRYIFHDDEHDKLSMMTYGEAFSFLAERAEKISSWEAFLDAAHSPDFWVELFRHWLFLFVFSMTSCIVIVMWLRRQDIESKVQ